MNFTSPLFLIGFPLVCAIYRKLPDTSRRLPQGSSERAARDGSARRLLSRQTLLLLASWLFYMGGSLKSFPLLLLVTLVTYLGGIAIEKARAEQSGRAGALLALVLCFVFGILFFFKYFGFVQNTVFHLIGTHSRGLRLPLPAGISFYSFQSLSYCLDVYRGKLRAERSFRDFALFVSFFPQLVAGPIERAEDLLPQLRACPSPTESDTRTGALYILRGFFKKIVIADFVSAYVSALFDAGRYSGPLTLLAGMLFGFQIYADFSGYSDIALGAARLLGIRLHVNFDSPYLADSIREFWRRWHITLTNWFTDYVYIPLGGSRRGTAVHVRNILIVFLLSGFWHGADWHFAAWGLYHGVLLSCAVLWEKARGRRGFSAEGPSVPEDVSAREGVSEGQTTSEVGPGRGPARLLRTALTFLLTSLGWVLFRTSSVRQAFSMYAGLSKGWTDPGILRAALLTAGATLSAASLVRIALIPVLLYLIRTIPEDHSSAKKDGLFENNIFEIIAFLMAAAILVSWIGNLAGGTGNDFIYFRF
ncbi:MAG: MBOAT family protein [Lachnospiraceae bacterium]|nr:MBOAT family protein [Lachnospiraceae bacterium]